MSDDLGNRLDALAQNVLAPLVLGGRVSLVRPLGLHLALAIGKDRSITDLDTRSRIDVTRVRRARLLAPVDTLDDIDEHDWALVAALNDLLQVTNHELTGPFTRGRALRLLTSVVALCARIPAPGTVAGALARHATLGRALDVERVDTRVTWWTGLASFRGERPPSRLLTWRDFRRVRTTERRVVLAEMPAGAPGVEPEEWSEALGLWLTRTPLTDLATATRAAPAFGWSASTLALVATGPGRSLARRALAPHKHDDVMAVLTRAAAAIPEGRDEARAIAESFARTFAEGAPELAVEPTRHLRGMD